MNTNTKSPRINPETPPDILAEGWEIVQDRDTDYFRFRARHWVEESGLCDTPEEAVELCREHLGISKPR